MATPGPRGLRRLQSLIWLLIYAGLLSAVLGLATERMAPGQGRGLLIGGCLAALVGVLLIFVRAALTPRE